MPTTKHPGDGPTNAYLDNATAERVSTETVLADALRREYPQLELLIVPTYGVALFPYAQAGHATVTPVKDADSTRPSSLSWTLYASPGRRLDGNLGGLASRLVFGKFVYRWRGVEFLLYFASGRDGTSSYPQVDNYYILSAPGEVPRARDMLVAAGFWTNELHEEVLVFEQGYWSKSRELYDSIRSASWDKVILERGFKEAFIADHMSFFASRGTYEKLSVPWKRGIIVYGPPGNGKTISIKAMMHMLYELKEPIPTLYVRSLTSYGGPEMALSQIFQKAREVAPCYLVFEDLDSIVSDFARSYFLNEVDGLKNNDGIFMIGSTNHLDRLDPGISKRPSRFDRKYLFPDPDRDGRVAYCRFWQGKLKGNEEIGFPDALCEAIADITDGFSFAYMQEAFVASLLAIARRSDAKGVLEDGWVDVTGEDEDDEDLEKLVLWVEIKKQIKILRESMSKEERI